MKKIFTLILIVAGVSSLLFHGYARDDGQQIEWFYTDTSINQIADIAKSTLVPGSAKIAGFTSPLWFKDSKTYSPIKTNVELVIDSSNSEAMALLGALLLKKTFSVLLINNSPSNNTVTISSQKDWLLVFGKKSEFEYKVAQREMLTNIVASNLEAAAKGKLNIAIKESLDEVKADFKYDPGRLATISRSFESLLVNQSINVASKANIDITAQIDKIQKGERFIANQRIMAAQLEQPENISKAEHFQKLVQTFASPNVNEHERNIISHKLGVMIAEADSTDLVKEYATLALNGINVEVTKELLRKLADRPIASLLPACIILARSEEPMVAYNAMRVLSEYGYPKMPSIPDAQSYKKNIAQYRSEWNRFLDQLQSNEIDSNNIRH